jgi:hypothetical protein
MGHDGDEELTGRFTTAETINTLAAIFEKHSQERVCVIGTICVGKTTLLRRLSGFGCEDLDSVLWPNLPDEETAFLSQRPWTEEMGAEIDRLIRRDVRIRPGHPLFTSVIVDCEVVVYLDIADDILAEHCKKRGEDFTDAKSIKEAIEEDWDIHKAKNDKTLYYVVITE